MGFLNDVEVLKVKMYVCFFSQFEHCEDGILGHFSARQNNCARNQIYLIILFNPLKPELNPICYLLALLGAHHFLHVSRIRVKLLTLRLLMSYIYMEYLFLMFLDHTQRRSTVGRTPLDE